MTACTDCGDVEDHVSTCSFPQTSRSEPTSDCPDCWHPVVEHSREPDIGCLRVMRFPYPWPTELCPCLDPGNSQADQ